MEINVAQTEEISNVDTGFPYQEKTYIEPEDFSIREGYPENNEYPDKEILDQKNNQQNIQKTETKETLLKENHEAFRESITQEKHHDIQNEVKSETRKEFHSDNVSQATLTTNTQVTKEIKESSTVPSENQTHNESLLNKSETSSPETTFLTPDEKKTSISFNEKIHKEDWIERESSFEPNKNKEEENKL